MAETPRGNRSKAPSPATRQQEPIAPVYFFTPDIEREIGKLDSVISARVLSSGNTIEEIHVLASPGRPPKKLVRDIESLLIVHFGIRVDHRKIGIVHLGQEAGRAREAARPQILSVVEKRTEDNFAVVIDLWQDGLVFQGEATMRPGETELHVSSRALLAAIEKLLNLTNIIVIKDVATVTMNGQQIVVVLLNWLMDEEVLSLVGATASQGNPLEAAARATFDALNRKLVRVGWGQKARAPAGL